MTISGGRRTTALTVVCSQSRTAAHWCQAAISFTFARSVRFGRYVPALADDFPAFRAKDLDPAVGRIRIQGIHVRQRWSQQNRLDRSGSGRRP